MYETSLSSTLAYGQQKVLKRVRGNRTVNRQMELWKPVKLRLARMVKVGRMVGN
jgi:hypothetical protein